MKCPKCGYDFNQTDDVTRLYLDNWGFRPGTPAETRLAKELIDKYSYGKVEKAFAIAASQKNFKLAYVTGILKKIEEKEYISRSRAEAEKKKEDIDKAIGGFDFSEILRKDNTVVKNEEKTQEEKQQQIDKEKLFEAKLLEENPAAYKEYINNKKRK